MALEHVRNIGIVAHINAGKTTLTERILFDTGALRAMGEVDDGTAAMDWMPEEQERGISIHAAVTHVDWKGFRLQLIDTPGHVDFTAEIERCLRVLDAVVLVIDSVRGVESQTEIIWRQVQARAIPCLVFINKMDRETADFEGSLISVSERLGCPTLPLVLPERTNQELTALIDIVQDRVRGHSDTAPKSWAPSRQAVIDACAERDDALLSDFVEGNLITGERLVASLRAATLEGKVAPVFAGSALYNRGVDLLLDGVCQYLPSPLDRPAIRGLGPGDSEISRHVDGPFCGLVFKVHVEDDQVLYSMRVYSGHLTVGDTVGTSRPEVGSLLVEKLFRLSAMEQEEISDCIAGSVVAVQVDAELRTGDTLFDPAAPIRLEQPVFPSPVLTMALEPASADDLGNLRRHAELLAREDPTLLLSEDETSGNLLVSGMGELHLQVFGQRLVAAMGGGQKVRLGSMRVVRRTTLGEPAEVQAECRAHHGPDDRSVRVVIAMEPGPGLGRCEISDGADFAAVQLARDLLAAELRSGTIWGEPATDLRARILSVEGDVGEAEGEALLGQAVAMACRKAARGGVVTLEPIMDYDVTCPSDASSGVIADLRSRNARIGSVQDFGDWLRVRGQVALAAVLGYPTRLRSLTRGLGTVSLSPRGFGAGAMGGEKERGSLDPPMADR